MGRAWSTNTSTILTMPIIFDSNTGKNSQVVKTSLNLEAGPGESRTAYELAGESKNTLASLGNDMDVRA